MMMKLLIFGIKKLVFLQKKYLQMKKQPTQKKRHKCERQIWSSNPDSLQQILSSPCPEQMSGAGQDQMGTCSPKTPSRQAF